MSQALLRLFIFVIDLICIQLTSLWFNPQKNGNAPCRPDIITLHNVSLRLAWQTWVFDDLILFSPICSFDLRRSAGGQLYNVVFLLEKWLLDNNDSYVISGKREMCIKKLYHKCLLFSIHSSATCHPIFHPVHSFCPSILIIMTAGSGSKTKLIKLQEREFTFY